VPQQWSPRCDASSVYCSVAGWSCAVLWCVLLPAASWSSTLNSQGCIIGLNFLVPVWSSVTPLKTAAVGGLLPPDIPCRCARTDLFTSFVAWGGGICNRRWPSGIPSPASTADSASADISCFVTGFSGLQRPERFYVQASAAVACTAVSARRDCPPPTAAACCCLKHSACCH
jgi:hypothetical protein